MSDAVLCFGVGEGWPCEDRNHASFLIRIGKTHCLFDAGDGLSGSQRAAGLPPDLVDGVFLSHMHSDHVGGFSLYVQALWLEGRRRPLPVHMPALGIPAMRAWLKATVLFDGLVGFPIDWQPLVEGVPIRREGLTVTAFPTTHLESLRRAFQPTHPDTSFQAFSFRVEGEGKAVAYTADLGCAADLDPLLAAPLDLLICEASHVPVPEILARLRGKPIRQVVFVHLERSLWSDRDRFLAEARAALGPIQCAIARDGDIFPF